MMGRLDRQLEKLSRQVVETAIAKGRTLGTAESLTGGMIAASLAGVPGASQVLMGGIVSYDPRIKQELLGVSQGIIGGVGVVSTLCAWQMARGARDRLGVDIAVSATGLAGPGGGTAECPVGTVFLGVAAGPSVWAEEHHFTGGRQAIRKKAAATALEMILNAMK